MMKSRYSEEETGRVLIPHVIDDLARDEPDRILYELPQETILDLDYRPVSAALYANAINRAAWFLEKSLGKGTTFDTLGYVGPGDLRYLILMVAAIKAGYKMLFTSPRNSLEGEIAVIEGVHCKTWLVPSKGSNIQRVLAVYPLSILNIPDLDYFLDSEAVPHYNYNKKWDVGRSEPCWVLHTSGSTGHPKPVIRSLASVSCFGANLICGPVDGQPLLMHEFFNTRTYITFPLFHAAGLNNSLLWPLFYGCTVILGPELPVTTDVMKHVIKHGKPNSIFAAPSLLEDISKDDEFLVILESMKVIAYAGGPLTQQAGDIISERTKVILSMGTTESGWHISVELNRLDWNNIRFHPNTGFELQEVSEGLYELVAIRRPELEKFQIVFETFPDEQEYHFKDLFSKHPTSKDVWHYQGRIDNIIVLSNGEKLNPVQLEIAISGHPLVDSLLVAGQGRFQTSLLVEPVRNVAHGTKSDQQIIDELWPSVQKANLDAPSHARISKSHILIASPDRPFLRASKGTVRKAPTLQLYEKDIDHLYARADLDQDADDTAPLNTTSEEALMGSIKNVVHAITELETLGEGDDFFAAGVDSLQVLTLQRNLKKGLRASNDKKIQIKTSLVYQNPTIKLLSHAIWLLYTAEQNGCLPSREEARVQEIRNTIDRYTSGLPVKSKSSNRGANQVLTKAVVILTGSTGSLGSYLLEALINTPTIHEIWCLNRSADAEQRQTTSNARRGLATDWKSSNVHFRQANLSKEDLGLLTEDYVYLTKHATNFIHTQWQVDFNLALPSFEQHVRGVRNIVDFILAASNQNRDIPIFFTSSIGVASNWKSPASVPERPITDLSVARGGYGESKLAAECVLLEAAQRSGVDVTIGRVGQIAGPTQKYARKGMWNRKEWLPSIIDASAELSLVPATLGKNNSIDWIPVDILAEIIVQLTFKSSEFGSGRIFHLVNPQKASWEDILPAAVERLSGSANENKIDIVSWNEWVKALVDYDHNRRNSEGLSALKLIDFFQSIQLDEKQPKLRAVFETTGTVTNKAFEQLSVVNQEWMRTWLDQWGYLKS